MAYSCTNRCEMKYVREMLDAKGQYGRYARINGRKVCRTCGWSIVWEGIHCPCCGLCLSTHNRASGAKCRRKLMATVERVV